MAKKPSLLTAGDDGQRGKLGRLSTVGVCSDVRGHQGARNGTVCKVVCF